MSTYYDNTDRNAYVALGALFGIAAGIGLGVLVAPRSGQETRQMMRERGMAAKQSASNQIAKRREMAMNAFSHSLDKSKAMVDKAAEKTKQATDAAAGQAENMADQAQTATGTGRSRRAG
jgi:gas vesicle protein